MFLALILSIFTALSFSFSGVIIKRFSARFGGIMAALAVTLGSTLVLAIAVMLLGHLSIGSYSFALSALSGIPLSLGYLLLYTVLEREQASNTFATLEVQAIILVIYGILFLGEKVSLLSGIGILAIMLGVIFVSSEKGLKISGKFVPAIATNVLWALSWIMLVYPITSTQNYLLPDLIAFAVGFAIALAIIFWSSLSKKAIGPLREGRILVGLTAGLFTGFGNLLYSMLIAMNQLVIVSVIANASPAIIATMAYFAYHERLTRVQALGIVAVVLGGILLGL